MQESVVLLIFARISEFFRVGRGLWRLVRDEWIPSNFETRVLLEKQFATIYNVLVNLIVMIYNYR